MDATRYGRRRTPADRRMLFSRSADATGQERCERCGEPIELATFHIAHLRAATHGGPAVDANEEAWCMRCNLEQGASDVCDTRVPLRDWQAEALPRLLEKLTMARVATLMAAPGAGKTLFTGALFAAGQEAGLWQRLLVLVPRLPLVNQWERSLKEDCHIGLDIQDGARGSGIELRGMDGICNTYQGLLSGPARERNRQAIERVPTLVALDEVHHLGQPARTGADEHGAAWSKAVRDVVGDLRVGLHAYVLNLSGTLFRTSPTERISTVEYRDVEGPLGEPRIQAIADYEIHSERLIRPGLLRPPDLYRVGATVEIVNLRTTTITTSAIADLDDDASARLALRRLNLKETWISQLVTVTLDQLKARHLDSKGQPVKALIVTPRQDMARAFAQEVDRQMVERRLQPLAECVVSDDGPDAYRRLNDFRLSRRSGVLCTVGMAGEGYDCPDICVVTYATNVMTAQNVRQVVARGQRVTEWERQRFGHPLTTAVVLPDVPDLVMLFTSILAPMVHDIEAPDEAGPAPPDRPTSGSATPWSETEVVSVRDAALTVVSAIGTGGTFHVDPAILDLVTPILEAADIPQSYAPRIAHVIQAFDKQRPFSEPVLPAAAVVERPSPVKRPMTPREHHTVIRGRLTLASGWWAQFPMKQGGPPVGHFMRDVYQVAGITVLDLASPDQLRRAVVEAVRRITLWCEQNHRSVPKWCVIADDDE